MCKFTALAIEPAIRLQHGHSQWALQAQIVALLARKSALSAIVSGPRHAYTVSIYTVCHDKAAAQSLKQFKLDKTHVIAGSSLNASVEEAL